MAPLLIAAIISTSTLRQSASTVADQYHLNKAHFLATLQCESGFAYDAEGDDGISIGIAQINLSSRAHPEVTRAQALDPNWSLVWMAKEWLAGRAWQWTCWKDRYL